MVVNSKRADKDLSFLRIKIAIGNFLDDPDKLHKALLSTVVDQAERLETLETTLESVLIAAFDNYDPIVAQLSEVRQEIARMRTDRSTVLADRDGLWCRALATVDWGVNDGLGFMQAVLAKFNELRLKDDRPSR